MTMSLYQAAMGGHLDVVKLICSLPGIDPSVLLKLRTLLFLCIESLP